MPFGFMDTTYIDFPANIDQAYIAGLQNRAGLNFTQVLAEVDNRLGAANATTDPLVAALARPTTEVDLDGTGPQAFKPRRRGEYTLDRPQLAEGAAHMLPLYGLENAIGWTEEGLLEASMNKIVLQIESAILGFKVQHRKDALTRLFSNAEERISVKSTATSPGFAGSGTGLNVFSIPYPNGTALPGGYTHYYRTDAAGLAATLKAARDRLRKWHPAPFDLIAPATQIAAISALPDFVSAGSELVRVGNGTPEALVDASTYAGVYDKDIRVRMAIDDFSSENIAIFKTYGNFDARNPLAWRYDELRGRNMYVRYRSFFPLDQANLLQDYGIGVGNRTGAVLIHVAASGSYVPPTIS